MLLKSKYSKEEKEERLIQQTLPMASVEKKKSYFTCYILRHRTGTKRHPLYTVEVSFSEFNTDFFLVFKQIEYYLTKWEFDDKVNHYWIHPDEVAELKNIIEVCWGYECIGN